MTAIYGHRGARGERPENTIEGFLHAGSLRLAGIECDIALTRDFVPVVHHDPELSLGKLIRDLRFDELSLLAPHVPTLAQALNAAPDMEWLIEIKTFPDAPQKTHSPLIIVQAVLTILKNAGKFQQVCIMAFDWRVLSVVAKYAPRMRRVCLTAPETEERRNIWWGEEISEARAPDAVAQAGAYGWAPFHMALTERQIRRAHFLGLKVFPWTVNEASEFRRPAPKTDGIITDFPSRLSHPSSKD